MKVWVDIPPDAKQGQEEDLCKKLLRAAAAGAQHSVLASAINNQYRLAGPVNLLSLLQPRWDQGNNSFLQSGIIAACAAWRFDFYTVKSLKF